MLRVVFFVSDGTSITASNYGYSILSQFQAQFQYKTIPFLDTLKKGKELRDQLDTIYQENKIKPLVFYSLVSEEIVKSIQSNNVHYFNIISPFVPQLEKILGTPAQPRLHRTHSITPSYINRIEAIQYSMENDDGINLNNLKNADLILIGVSRCGKTPTSLYLSLQHGIKVANYPFIQDDMDNLTLPKKLKEFKEKLFGLTINFERLHEIRSQRISGITYSSLHQCRSEVKEVELLFQKHKIPCIDTTSLSVEEISAKILFMTKIDPML